MVLLINERPWLESALKAVLSRQRHKQKNLKIKQQYLLTNFCKRVWCFSHIFVQRFSIVGHGN